MDAFAILPLVNLERRRDRMRRWLLFVLPVLAWSLCAAALLTAPSAVPADVPLPVEETPAPSSTPSGGLIALTFDDGPRRSTTTALLDGLAARGVQATFFLIGKQVAEYNQDLLQRMDAEGHQIGIHTYDHVMLSGLNAADFSAQVDKTRSLFQSILGHNGFLLRPPYGSTDPAVRSMAGCPIILWSIDPEDWDDQNADRVVEHVVSRAKDGDIILLHDIFPTSVEAALRIVDQLHARGFYFVTVEELFAARHITLEPGKVYRCAYP